MRVLKRRFDLKCPVCREMAHRAAQRHLDRQISRSQKRQEISKPKLAAFDRAIRSTRTPIAQVVPEATR
jgi:hypothetical protein